MDTKDIVLGTLSILILLYPLLKIRSAVREHKEWKNKQRLIWETLHSHLGDRLYTTSYYYLGREFKTQMEVIVREWGDGGYVVSPDYYIYPKSTRKTIIVSEEYTYEDIIIFLKEKIPAEGVCLGDVVNFRHLGQSIESYIELKQTNEQELEELDKD